MKETLELNFGQPPKDGVEHIGAIVEKIIQQYDTNLESDEARQANIKDGLDAIDQALRDEKLQRDYTQDDIEKLLLEDRQLRQGLTHFLPTEERPRFLRDNTIAEAFYAVMNQLQELADNKGMDAKEFLAKINIDIPEGTPIHRGFDESSNRNPEFDFDTGIVWTEEQDDQGNELGYSYSYKHHYKEPRFINHKLFSSIVERHVWKRPANRPNAKPTFVESQIYDYWY